MTFDKRKRTGGGRPPRKRRQHRPQRTRPAPERDKLPHPAVLYTVGMGKRPLQGLMQLLVDTGVGLLADLRVYAAESGPGFTRERDLAFLLKEVAGIEYRREEPLLPSREMREQYRRDRNWSRFEESYLKMLSMAHVEEILDRELYASTKVCLLGDQESAAQDYRRLAAEYLQKHWQIGLIEHL
jgi:hypothetical protein